MVLACFFPSPDMQQGRETPALLLDREANVKRLRLNGKRLRLTESACG
jgi:hypothetical protein